MSEMKFTGRVVAFLPHTEGTSQTGRRWMIDGMVLETVEEHPRRVACEVTSSDENPRFKEWDVKMGETLTVWLDVDAREWKGRWYNSVKAWKMQRIQ